MFIIIPVANPEEEKQTNPNVFLTPAKGFLDRESVKRTACSCTRAEMPRKAGPPQRIASGRFKGVFYPSTCLH